MDRDVIADLLVAIASRVTPLEQGEMKLFIAAFQAAFPRGVYCSYGKDGSQTQREVCIPGRWTTRKWEERTRTCFHCPIFKYALSRK